MQKEQGSARESGRASGNLILYAALGILAVGAGAVTGYYLRSPAPAPAPRLIAKETAGQAESMGIRNLIRHKEPQPVADIAFVDADGKPKHLSDWRGKVVLLNLWATWCGPCKLEMPSLDRLQAKLGGKDFTVVAVSTDRTGRAQPAEFLQKAGIKNLALYNDDTAESVVKLKADGLPVSLIVNAKGEEVARLLGPAQWDSPEAEEAVRGFLPKG
jgi:thiol-disulfide isomerase/thioredoxin